MGNMIGTSQNFNIHAENEVAEVLSHFNSDFIQSFIKNKLDERFIPSPAMDPVNIVGSLEQNFKQILDAYPEAQRDIWNKRSEVYLDIIRMILETYHLEIDPTYESRSGYYTEAGYLYDFFVSGFLRKAIDFFSNVILENAASIAKHLGIDEHKDATPYDKKVYTGNVKLGILVNNIDRTMQTVCGMDFTLEDILNHVYAKEDREIFTSFIRDRGDFYKDFYVYLMNTSIQAAMLTDIRLAVHAKYVTMYGANINNPIMQVMEG